VNVEIDLDPLFVRRHSPLCGLPSAESTLSSPS
jgi:hypothetical protein